MIYEMIIKMEKNLGPHALLSAHAHALGDTPYPSREYGRMLYEAGKRSLWLS